MNTFCSISNAFTATFRATKKLALAFQALVFFVFITISGLHSAPVQAASTSVVISQVYGGGGNIGAPYNSDYVELFNLGTSSVNLSGWSVQYAVTNSATWTSIPLSGSIAPGKYYLIKLGNGGATGAALPTADASLTTLNINAITGKVALLNTTTLLTVAVPSAAQAVDLIGYGTADAFETVREPALSNTTSAIRVACLDTDNNDNDFIAATPAPHNSASASYSCSGVLLAQYRLDETTWGTVKDSSGNGYNASTAGAPLPTTTSTSPARTGTIGTCGYGTFANGSGEITASSLPVDTSAGAQTSVSFWMYWDGTGNIMPIGWQAYDLWLTGGSFGFNTSNSDIYGISSSTPTTLVNGWHHVVAVFTNQSVISNKLYIDGNLQTLTQRASTPTNALAVVGSTLHISGWGNSTGYKFSSRLDEVQVFKGPLTQAQVTALYNETHPCGALVNVQKSMQVLCDPSNGISNPKNIPGAIVKWSITVSNASNASSSATLTSISDTLNTTTMTFDPNLITGAGTPPASCASSTGTPQSAAGKGFSLDVSGDTRPSVYPKYLTTSSADSDGASYNAGNISINYGLAMPAETGYTAGELKPGESAVVNFNATVK